MWKYMLVLGIYALWFYNKEDSKKMFDALTHYQSCSNIPAVQKVPNGLNGKTQPVNGIRPVQSTGSILTMLTAADDKVDFQIRIPCLFILC